MVKNIIISIQFIAIVVLAWLFYNASSKANQLQSLGYGNSTQQQNKKAENLYKDANLSFECIEAVGGTWGYKILLEGSTVIVQSNKPGFPGNEGFKTKEKAQKVAELVISKIREGQMPPTVTIEEMKNLDAI